MKILTTLTLSLLASASISSAAISFGNTLFIGDSITEASSAASPSQSNGGYSWRYSFWKNMIDNGDTFHFVGSRTSNQGGSSTYPMYSGVTFVNQHEAIWGTTALERSNTLAGQYTTYNADTAFILLGTNDLYGGASASQVPHCFSVSPYSHLLFAENDRFLLIKY